MIAAVAEDGFEKGRNIESIGDLHMCWNAIHLSHFTDGTYIERREEEEEEEEEDHSFMMLFSSIFTRVVNVHARSIHENNLP